jgi:hypothetical protein
LKSGYAKRPGANRLAFFMSKEEESSRFLKKAAQKLLRRWA